MPHDYAVLDVFTDAPFSGNPLAVVREADDLSPERMQAIAREFNLSETVFLLKPGRPAHTARVRIFTPGRELPFAGHPTVGTAILLANDLWPGEGERDGLVVLEEEIGPVRVGVRLGKGPAFAEFDIPKMPEPVEGGLDPERVAAALGLMPREIGFENHRPSQFTAGVPFSMVPVRDLSALKRCLPNRRAFDEAFAATGHAYCYTRQSFSEHNDFHVRMFSPGLGIDEDPATGAAAAAFAGVLMAFDGPTAGQHRYRIEQGHVMGRPSLIELELEVDRGRLHAVRIGGAAVIVARGQLTL